MIKPGQTLIMLGAMILILCISQLYIMSNTELLAQELKIVTSVASSMHMPLRIHEYMDIALHMTNPSITRVATIVIYVGETSPAWFESFAFTAQFSAPIMDWFIFVTDLPEFDFPPNVYVVQISKKDLYRRIATIMKPPRPRGTPDIEHEGSEEHQQLWAINSTLGEQRESSLQVLLEEQPYLMVELKPCLGVIFEDYLSSYSHWAFADIDTALGKMNTLLTPAILQHYDIYTISFGDSYRYYMRGQLTVHRNDPYVNNIWRSCDHLSNFQKRLDTYMNQRAALNKGTTGAIRKPRWHFASAEGCYSQAVASYGNISALVAPTLISDAFSADLNKKEWILLGDTLMRCHLRPVDVYLHPESALDKGLKDVSGFLFGRGYDSTSWNVPSDTSIRTPGTDPYDANWHLLKVVKRNCAYWIHPNFQVCLDYVAAGVDMANENGVFEYNEDNSKYLFKGFDEQGQLKPLSGDAVARVKGGGGGGCYVAVMAHTQGWKNGYYRFMTRSPSLNAHAVLYSQAGFIPLRLESPNSKGLEHNLPTYEEITGVSLPYGRLSRHDIVVSASTQKANALSHGWQLSRFMGKAAAASSSMAEHLEGIVDTSSANKDPEGVGVALSYCGGFTDDLKRCTCPILGSHITVLQVHNSAKEAKVYESAPEANPLGRLFGGESFRQTQVNTKITLIVALWARDYYDGMMDELLDSWTLGPVVVVLGVDSADTDNAQDTLSVYGKRTLIKVNFGHCVKHHQKRSISGRRTRERRKSKQPTGLPEHMLLNIGLDAAPTDVVCVVSAYSHRAFPNQNEEAKAYLKQHFKFNMPHLVTNSIAGESGVAVEDIASVISARIGNQAVVIRPVHSNHDESGNKHPCGSVKPKWIAKHAIDLEKTMSMTPGTLFPLLGPDSDYKLSDMYTNSEQLSNVIKELTKTEKSELLPVIFNQRASALGKDFVRFPEEFDGVNCHGSALYAVLIGSGYELATGASYITINSHEVAVPKATTAPKVIPGGEPSCGCLHGASVKVRVGPRGNYTYIMRQGKDMFSDSLNSYLTRASSLRETQLEETFSPEPFGYMFDRMQFDEKK